MNIEVSLEGDRVDLEKLRVIFPFNFPRIVRVSPDHFILIALEVNEAWPDSGAMWEEAEAKLRLMNGVAKLREADFHPVSIGYSLRNDEDGSEVMRLGLAVTNIVVSPLELPHSQDPWTGKFARLMATNSYVRDVLDVLGNPSPTLDWFDLYKVFELIRNSLNPPGKKGEKNLRAKAWCSEKDLGRFCGSANSRATSGQGARHATPTTNKTDRPLSDPMSLPEARRFVLSLTASWLEEL